eukprot:g4871.t1
MLHNASLIIDDIEDGSLLRRGRPAAHVVFGTPIALNAANWKYFDALSGLLELQSHDVVDADHMLEIVRIYTDEMQRAHRGQALDIEWRRNRKYLPSVGAYLDMVSCKTTTLFRAAFRMLHVFAPFSNRLRHEKWLRLIEDLGSFFQIRDDLANLVLYADSKGFCEDIDEGKYSFPAILCIRGKSVRSSATLLSILDQSGAKTNAEKNLALRCLCESGAMSQTAEKLRMLRRSIRKGLGAVGVSEDIEAFILAFVETSGLEKRVASLEGALV